MALLGPSCRFDGQKRKDVGMAAALTLAPEIEGWMEAVSLSMSIIERQSRARLARVVWPEKTRIVKLFLTRQNSRMRIEFLIAFGALRRNTVRLP